MSRKTRTQENAELRERVAKLEAERDILVQTIGRMLLGPPSVPLIVGPVVLPPPTPIRPPWPPSLPYIGDPPDWLSHPQITCSSRVQ